MNCLIYVLTSTMMAIGGARAQSPSGTAVPVTVENFVRAESDLYFGGFVNQGSFAKFNHLRELTPLDRQTVVRMNRDTLYSLAVFDLSAGPVTLVAQRGQPLHVNAGDRRGPSHPGLVYGEGRYTFPAEKVSTRYIGVGVRTLVDPTNVKDLDEVHTLQDAIKVSQRSPGRFEVPNWDKASQKKVHDA